MLTLAALSLIAGPAAEPPPDGWICRVSQVLASGARMDLVQSVEPSGSGFAVNAQLESGPDASGSPAWHWRWSLEPGDGLAEPRWLSVDVRLSKPDRKGRIRVDHASGRIDLPSTVPTLIRFGGKRATISIDDRSALRLLWASPRWRISVLDRKEIVRAAVEGVAPPRAEVEEAYRSLSASLAGKVAAPAEQCEEAGPDSNI
jgi:hypothetical protein